MPLGPRTLRDCRRLARMVLHPIIEEILTTCDPSFPGDPLAAPTLVEHGVRLGHAVEAYRLALLHIHPLNFFIEQFHDLKVPADIQKLAALEARS